MRHLSYGLLILVFSAAIAVGQFVPQGAQVRTGLTISQSSSSSDCQLCSASTALANLFHSGPVNPSDPGWETSPTNPDNIFGGLDAAVTDPENSDQVAGAADDKGDELGGGDLKTDVTGYGDVKTPNGGASGGPTTPICGIGPNESMILLCDFPSGVGHALLLQSKDPTLTWYGFADEPPASTDPVNVSWGGYTWWIVQVYKVKVWDPFSDAIIEVLITPGGDIYDTGVVPSPEWGNVGGGIRITVSET
ncbi:MAG: hypothetical protein V3W41_21250 [Planctomycetota bacterium]